MKKNIFILLCSLVLFQGLYGMKPDFKKQQQERRREYKKPYNKEDQQKLSGTFSTIIAGTVITSAGCILQEPIIIGLGVGLMIGGTDDVSNYYKFQRRYNQKTEQ